MARPPINAASEMDSGFFSEGGSVLDEENEALVGICREIGTDFDSAPGVGLPPVSLRKASAWLFCRSAIGLRSSVWVVSRSARADKCSGLLAARRSAL